MGIFSYQCAFCGSHEQFDFSEDCIVKISFIDNKSFFVKGKYDGYGFVDIQIKDSKTIKLPLIQFSWCFDSWCVEIIGVAEDIYCNGTSQECCYCSDEEEGEKNEILLETEEVKVSHKNIIRHCFCGKYRTYLTPKEVLKIKPYEKS